ncbi:MAG TPA: hypothetical protein IGS52_06630 [Oscillatoriaceae cyanobacterium M33_DOE_052]|uniref:Uncharacterized protein n=1 Tax=Planktothricoides sp. SpSt-374 TaxID=2282167 RepID=A0A7C3VGI5_9CYAN|nr:hypothetical protein [Oscillatoriaceae cyanobacterium M33_DOE_052]
MLLVIDWILVGAAAALSFGTGMLVGYFWDDIIAWANRVVGAILDAINYAIEVTSDAVVKLVKEGSRYYKEAEVYVMNIRTGKLRIESRRQEVNENQIPEEYLNQLRRKAALQLLQRPT